MPVTAYDEEFVPDRLAADLDAFEPGPAPVDAAIWQGRAIRTRRRAALAGGLAALAVIGLGILLALGARHAAPPVPTRPMPGRVTVDQPHQESKDKLVFGGTVDGVPWSASADLQTACYLASGMQGCFSPGQRDEPATLVDLIGQVSDRDTVRLQAVHTRAEVASVGLVLTDGERLTLRTSPLGADRIAFFMLPQAVSIDRITAVGADGRELGFSIVHRGVAATWYHPGETPTQVEASVDLPAGMLSGQKASVTVETGPFGVFFAVSGDTLGYENLDVPAPASVQFHWFGGTDDRLAAAQVNPAVHRVAVERSDGRTDQLIPVAIGGRSFVVEALPAGVRIVSTTPYDTAGKQPATSTVP